jgi:hypothetical protein
MAPTEKITDDVRQFLSRRLIERVVRNLGKGSVFFQSQSWQGYEDACESWHAAYWKWVEQQSPAKLVENLKQAGDWSKSSVASAVEMLTSAGMDCSKLPPAEDDKKQWLEEFARHEMLQHYVSFSTTSCRHSGDNRLQPMDKTIYCAGNSMRPTANWPRCRRKTKGCAALPQNCHASAAKSRECGKTCCQPIMIPTDWP